jgi:hypothetical protein
MLHPGDGVGQDGSRNGIVVVDPLLQNVHDGGRPGLPKRPSGLDQGRLALGVVSNVGDRLACLRLDGVQPSDEAEHNDSIGLPGLVGTEKTPPCMHPARSVGEVGLRFDEVAAVDVEGELHTPRASQRLLQRLVDHIPVRNERACEVAEERAGGRAGAPSMRPGERRPVDRPSAPIPTSASSRLS